MSPQNEISIEEVGGSNMMRHFLYDITLLHKQVRNLLINHARYERGGYAVVAGAERLT
jgi:hypothetical protein